MSRAIGILLLRAIAALLGASISTPEQSNTGIPSAIIANADTARLRTGIRSHLHTVPPNIPVHTRWNEQVINGLLIPPETAGARTWIYSAPSDQSGVGSLLIPLSVTWTNGKWIIQKQSMSFGAEAVRSVATTPMPATVPVKRPSVTRSGPLSYPGMMGTCQVIFLPPR